MEQAAQQAKESGNLGGLTTKEYAAGAKEQLTSKIEHGDIDKENLMSTVKSDNAGEQVNGMLDHKNVTDATGNVTSKVDTDKLKAAGNTAKKAAGNAAENGGGSVFKKAGDWLADNGEEVGKKVSDIGQRYSAKKGTPTSSAMVASGRTGNYNRPDFSGLGNEISRRKQKIGMRG